MSESLPFGLTTDFFYALHAGSGEDDLRAVLDAFRSPNMTADDAHNILTVVFNQDTRQRISWEEMTDTLSTAMAQAENDDKDAAEDREEDRYKAAIRANKMLADDDPDKKHISVLFQEYRDRVQAAETRIESYYNSLADTVRIGTDEVSPAFWEATANMFLIENIFPLDMLQILHDSGLSKDIPNAQLVYLVGGDTMRFARSNEDVMRSMGGLVWGYLKALKENDTPTAAQITFHTNQQGIHEFDPDRKGTLEDEKEPSPPESFEEAMARTEPHDDRSGAPPLEEAAPVRRVPDPPRGRGRERRARE